jgi:hypothetical protein
METKAIYYNVLPSQFSTWVAFLKHLYENSYFYLELREITYEEAHREYRIDTGKLKNEITKEVLRSFETKDRVEALLQKD